MTVRQVDPGRLSGTALTQWYLRTPDQIDEERQRASQRAHDDFFGAPALREAVLPMAAKPAARIEDRDLTWIEDGPSRWKAVVPSSGEEGFRDAEGSWQEARVSPPPARPVMPQAPTAPRVGPRLDGIAPAPAGTSGFFGRFPPVPYPDGPAYVTRLPSPLNSVVPQLGGWFQLGDGSVAPNALDVERIYAEQQQRMQGRDEPEPPRYAHPVDRLRDGQIPRADQLEEGERELDPTCHPNGGWERDENFGTYSERSRRYQAQITRAPGLDYVVRNPGQNPVKFDGCAVWDRRHPLLEAKGPGYESLIEAAQQYEFIDPFTKKRRSQAQGQAGAALGFPVDWHIAERGATPFFQALVRPYPGMTARHTPAR